jgi:hypothetical protein
MRQLQVSFKKQNINLLDSNVDESEAIIPMDENELAYTLQFFFIFLKFNFSVFFQQIPVSQFVAV